MVAEEIVAERLVFVDECGTHTSLAPIYGYALRGERLYLSGGAARQRQEHDAAFEHERGGDGAVAGRRRSEHRAGIGDLYVEKVLLPRLREGQIVVMDKTSVPTGRNASGS